MMSGEVAKGYVKRGEEAIFEACSKGGERRGDGM
jgi:hypothetical protein